MLSRIDRQTCGAWLRDAVRRASHEERARTVASRAPYSERRFLRGSAGSNSLDRARHGLAIVYLRIGRPASPEEFVSSVIGVRGSRPWLEGFRKLLLQEITAGEALAIADRFIVYEFRCQRCGTFLFPIAVEPGSVTDGICSAVCHRCETTSLLRPELDGLRLRVRPGTGVSHDGRGGVPHGRRPRVIVDLDVRSMLE